ncbi:MAG: VOC family protein [Actinomycetota bacterium]|nr:glyoxalase [Acidimicrobiaceae bacterium]MCH2621374.1 VOC family protein [Acidimicrobiales bacterium]MEC7899784.1 VOC family protein [Actinomycetota bacterium]
MSIIGMNHAVLYVRDARVHKDFYSRVLGFTTNIEDSNGQFVFMRAPNSSNHHDVAFFSVGGHASPSTAGRQSVGLYHIAWEVETLAELEETKKTLEREGCLVGASDHGVNKSLYAVDPDGIEFEVMWLTPEKFWGDSETSAVIEPLDLEGEIEKFGRDLKGGS